MTSNPTELTRLQSGDAATWRAVLTEHGPMLLGYATRMLKDRALAEDVVQDALVSAYRKIGGFDGRSSVKAWLTRIVRNRAIDVLRGRNRLVEMPDGDPDAGYFDERGRWAISCPRFAPTGEKALDEQRLVDRLRVAMDALPHGQRDVLLLKEVHGFTTEEICAALDLEPGNVRIRIHRARKALRAAVLQGATLEES